MSYEDDLRKVRENGLALESIREQTPELCMEAVKQNGSVLPLVKQQSSEIQEAAFKQIESRPGIVGYMVFHGSNGVGDIAIYDTPKQYLDSYRDLLDSNPQGFKATTVTRSPEVRKAVDDLVYGFYGDDNPHDLKYYAEKEEKKKPYYQQNVEKVVTAVKENRVPFIVTTEGMIDTQKIALYPAAAVRSAETGKVYKGINQLVAQISLQEMGKNDIAVLTFEQAKKFGTGIRKGEKSFFVTSFDSTAEEGKKSKVYHLFPASSVFDKENLAVPLEKISSRNRENARQNLVITCKESEPEKYIGAYLAASSIGARFETDVKTMNTFQKGFVSAMEKEIAQGRHAVLFETGKRANEHCKTVLKELNENISKERVPERKRSVVQEMEM